MGIVATRPGGKRKKKKRKKEGSPRRSGKRKERKRKYIKRMVKIRNSPSVSPCLSLSALNPRRSDLHKMDSIIPNVKDAMESFGQKCYKLVPLWLREKPKLFKRLSRIACSWKLLFTSSLVLNWITKMKDTCNRQVLPPTSIL